MKYLKTYKIFESYGRYLDWSSRNLKEIKNIPPRTGFFICHKNDLSELPKLPKTLIELDCTKNYIKNLPELPPNMTHLFCSHNKLRVLPELPKTLKRLDCDNNELIELPTLPPNLKDLNCSYNNLKKLPELPDTLEELTCNYNDWEEPIKTEYVFKFKIMYTPLRRDMFRDENFQRKFLTEHPERFKDLEVNQIGIQPIIKKEFAHLFEGDDMGFFNLLNK